MSKTKGTLTVGQIHAFSAIVDIEGDGGQGLRRSMELHRALEHRVPLDYLSYWLDSVAMTAGRLDDDVLFKAAYEASAESAGIASGECMRRQRYARMLCTRGRYTEALQQLEKNASAAVDSRISVMVERQLISCWALEATNDRTGARRYLDSAWELLNRYPHFYGRDNSIEMVQGLTAKLAA